MIPKDVLKVKFMGVSIVDYREFARSVKNYVNGRTLTASKSKQMPGEIGQLISSPKEAEVEGRDEYYGDLSWISSKGNKGGEYKGRSKGGKGGKGDYYYSSHSSWHQGNGKTATKTTTRDPRETEEKECLMDRRAKKAKEKGSSVIIAKAMDTYRRSVHHTKVKDMECFNKCKSAVKNGIAQK